MHELYKQNQELKQFIPELIEILYVKKPNVNDQKSKERLSEMKEADVKKLKLAEETNIRLAKEANLPYTDALFKVDYYLRLGNLMKGRENASIIDLKMGKSTVTCNIIDSKRMAKRLAKDKTSTSSVLGFKVIGYVIKSAEKEAEERFYKFP